MKKLLISIIFGALLSISFFFLRHVWFHSSKFFIILLLSSITISQKTHRKWIDNSKEHFKLYNFIKSCPFYMEIYSSFLLGVFRFHKINQAVLNWIITIKESYSLSTVFEFSQACLFFRFLSMILFSAVVLRHTLRIWRAVALAVT